MQDKKFNIPLSPRKQRQQQLSLAQSHALFSSLPSSPHANNELQDYQLQLMLLEQQNKKRLLMAQEDRKLLTAREEQRGLGQAAEQHLEGRKQVLEARGAKI